MVWVVVENKVDQSVVMKWKEQATRLRSMGIRNGSTEEPSRIFRALSRSRKGEPVALSSDSEVDLSEFAEILLETQYRLGNQIGCGHFGLVFAAESLHDGKCYAIKMFSNRNENSRKWIAFKEEARILSYLRGVPGVVHLREALTWKKQQALVLEFVPGQTLTSFIRSRTRLNEDETRSIFIALATVVKHLHNENVGIVHRDIKGENVMLNWKTINGQKIPIITLIDFGTACFVNDAERLKRGAGTFEYAAPEVLRGNPASTKCDSWSLGILLFALLAGYLPFHGKNDESTAALVLKGPSFHRLPWSDGSVSLRARNLVRKLLSMDEKRRYNLSECLNHPWITQEEFHDLERENSACLAQVDLYNLQPSLRSMSCVAR